MWKCKAPNGKQVNITTHKGRFTVPHGYLTDDWHGIVRYAPGVFVKMQITHKIEEVIEEVGPASDVDSSAGTVKIENVTKERAAEKAETEEVVEEVVEEEAAEEVVEEEAAPEPEPEVEEKPKKRGRKKKSKK
jgi:hypothetical protein